MLQVSPLHESDVYPPPKKNKTKKKKKEKKKNKTKKKKKEKKKNKGKGSIQLGFNITVGISRIMSDCLRHSKFYIINREHCIQSFPLRSLFPTES